MKSIPAHGKSVRWLLDHRTIAGYNRKNGIVGGHNKNAFDSAIAIESGRVTGRYSDPTMPGVETITYLVAARIWAGDIIDGEFRARTYQKTVYDPAVLSDQRVAQMSVQASQRATFSENSSQATVTIDWFKFRVHRNQDTNSVTNVHLTHQ
ncbi:CdiA family toxin C-terminal domain-containing protein [Aestuariibius sp. HNIBRBA575]|uniref:CdiA family toxin C-terminal domain-containing protein n=1 Tax=Aestuariibius sp. HNIBRBA575 TaxID=3233343 RepID=UPI0034A22411